MINRNNNDNELSLDAHLDELADLILNAESDMRPEFCELIEPLLAPPIYLEICARLEICPIHSCDLEICADDEMLDCLQYRN